MSDLRTSARRADRIGFAALVVVALANLLPSIGTPLRDADYVDLDLYTRHGVFEVFETSHLRAERVHFYRPLSDFVDALMVKAWGFTPWAYHVTLVLMILVNGVLLATLAHRWARNSRPFGWLAAVMYAAHPLQHGTLTYFEGGNAHITYLGFALAFFHSGLRFRERPSVARGAVMVLFLIAAMLCFDGALVLPFAWVGLEVIRGLPKLEGSTWRRLWGLALVPMVALIPVFAFRFLVLGEFLGGYGTGAGKIDLLGYGMAFAEVLGRIAYPAFDAVHAASPLPVLTAVMFFCTVGVVALVGLLSSREALWSAMSSMALLIAVVLPTTPDFVLEVMGERGELPLNGAYRLSVPMALSALTLAYLFASFASRLGRGRVGTGIVMTGGVVYSYLVLGKPIGDVCRHAGTVAEIVRQGVIEEAAKADEDDAILVIDTPLDVRLETLSVMRVFQYGLASSLRPPCHDPEILVYPLVYDPGQTILTRGALDALSLRADTRALRYDREREVMEPYRLRAADESPLSILMSSPKEGETVRLQDPQDIFKGEASSVVPLEEMKGPGFVVTFEVTGLSQRAWPVVVMINRVTPFYFERSPGGSHHLPMWLEDGGARLSAWVGGVYVQELLEHFGKDPIFLYVEAIDQGNRSVQGRSAVLRLLLSEDE